MRNWDLKSKPCGGGLIETLQHGFLVWMRWGLGFDGKIGNGDVRVFILIESKRGENSTDTLSLCVQHEEDNETRI